MLGRVRTPGPAHLGDLRRLARGIDHPGGCDAAALAVPGFETHAVFPDSAEFEILDRGRTDEFAAQRQRLPQHLGIERHAVDLEGGQTALKSGTKLGGPTRSVITFLVEPHPQAVLGDVFGIHVHAQAQHAGEKTAGHLRGALADFPIEFRSALDDQDSEIGELAFQQQRG